MLKGAQKKMYVVKMGEDSLFEEAYFVLKRDPVSVQGKDMVSEATRIIRQSAGAQDETAAPKKWPWQVLVSFACGLLTGGGVACAICLLL